MKNLLLTSMIALIAVAVFAASDEEVVPRAYDTKGFVMHEWGVIGSKADGSPPYKTDVPDFVKRSEEIDIDSISVWKPVIYFYSDKERIVTVKLRLPSRGTLLHWPPATGGLIGYVEAEDERKMLKSSEAAVTHLDFLAWSDVTITKTDAGWKPATGTFEAVDKKHWWHEARSPKASWVCCNRIHEKFLFYEQAFVPTMPTRMVCKDGIISLTPVVLANDTAYQPSTVLRDAMLVSINKGTARYCFKDKLDVSSELKFSDEDLAVTDSQQLARILSERLASAGLYTDEAVSMVDIWKEQFFKTDGVRLIYRMEQAEYDKLYPLEFSEKPDEVKRVILTVLEP